MSGRHELKINIILIFFKDKCSKLRWRLVEGILKDLVSFEFQILKILCFLLFKKKDFKSLKSFKIHWMCDFGNPLVGGKFQGFSNHFCVGFFYTSFYFYTVFLYNLFLYSFFETFFLYNFFYIMFYTTYF